jgi:chromosome segregation ATPase
MLREEPYNDGKETMNQKRRAGYDEVKDATNQRRREAYDEVKDETNQRRREAYDEVKDETNERRRETYRTRSRERERFSQRLVKKQSQLDAIDDSINTTNDTVPNISGLITKKQSQRQSK